VIVGAGVSGLYTAWRQVCHGQDAAGAAPSVIIFDMEKETVAAATAICSSWRLPTRPVARVIAAVACPDDPRTMFRPRDQALVLLANPLPSGGGRHARPTFEWDPPNG
jgi:hypothetical protein